MNRLMQSLTLGALALASGAVLAAEPAPTESGAYWGVYIGQVRYSESGLPSFNPTAFLASLGWELNRNVAFEARIGTGIGSDSKTVSGVPIDLKLKDFYGGYLRWMLPLSNGFSLYALTGYGHGKLEASSMGFTASTTDGSFSGGVGAEFAMNRSGAVGVEYGRLVSGSGYDANLISIGYRMRL